MADEENKVKDPREEKSFKDLQTELVERGFVGAEVLTTKAQAIAVLNSLDKKEEEAPASAAPTVMDTVKDNESVDKKKYFGKAAKMKEFCDSQPKVDFIIPLEIGEKRGAIATWQANGYRLNMLKGVRIRIPANVADALAESYQLTAAAGEEFLMDRPKNDPNAPYKNVREALE